MWALRMGACVFPGVCSTVTILLRKRHWQRYALYWVPFYRGVNRGGWGSWSSLKICRRGQSMFWSPKTATFCHSKLLSDNSASFTSSRTKDLCQKWKVKLIFEAPRLKQFDGLTWPTLVPPYFTTDLRHWRSNCCCCCCCCCCCLC